MRRKHSGATIIEVLGVLAIAAAMLGALSSQIAQALDDARGNEAAAYQAQVVGAARQFIRSNYATLALSVGVTAQYGLADLQAAKLLPPGMLGTNGYGQTPCLLVRARMAGTPAVAVIDALVVTEGLATLAIPDRQLAYVAAQAGPGGGYIAASDATRAHSSGGAWMLGPDTDPSLAQFLTARCSANTAGAGSLVSALFGGQQSNDYLYRQPVPGMPQLNQMNTPLGLTGAAVSSVGAACGGDAAMAVDASRNLLSCGVAGTWTLVGNNTWKASVANYASLPTGDNAGDVRLVRDTSRAFAYNGSAWVALAVDQNGDLAVTHDLHVTHDVNVDRNINALSGTLVANYVVGNDGVGGAILQTWDTGVLGDVCHIPLLDGSGAQVYDINGLPIYIHPIGTIIGESRVPWPGRTPSGLICSGTGPGDAFLVHFDG